MPTIREIRHANLLLLIRAAGTIQSLANKLGKSHSQLSQLRNQIAHSTTGKPRAIGDDLAREIEQTLEKPEGWMDQLHGEEELQGIGEPTNKLTQLGERLRATREYRKIARADAATQAGIQERELALIEAGLTEPSVFTMGELAKLYGYTVDALLWEDALSPQALTWASRWDHLPMAKQQALENFWLTFIEQPVSDADVEKKMPITETLRDRGTVIDSEGKASAEVAPAQPVKATR